MYATTLLFDYRNAFECQLRMDDCAAARSYTPISIPIEFETERKTTYNKYKTTFPSKCLVILSIWTDHPNKWLLSHNCMCLYLYLGSMHPHLRWEYLFAYTHLQLVFIFFLSWGRWRGKYVQTFVIYLNSNFILISLSFSTKRRRRRLRQCWWRRWLLHTFEFGHTFHINEGEMISCVNINNNLYALTLDHVLFFSFYDKLSPWLLKKVDKTKMTRKKKQIATWIVVNLKKRDFLYII